MPGLGLSAGATVTRRTWFLRSRTEHDEGRKHRQSAKGADVKGLIQPAEIWTDISEAARQRGTERRTSSMCACVHTCVHVHGYKQGGLPTGQSRYYNEFYRDCCLQT